MIAIAKTSINPAMSFGIMPAPGAVRVPKGRSPLIAKTTRLKMIKAAPATWSARSMMFDPLTSRGYCMPTRAAGAEREHGTGRVRFALCRLALNPSDRVDRGLDPLGVGIPEPLEFRLVHISDVLANIIPRLLEIG